MRVHTTQAPRAATVISLGLVLGLLCALGSGCDNRPDDEVRFEVSGVQAKYATCLGEAFPFNAQFNTARYRRSADERSSTSLIMQRSGILSHNDDLIFLEIFERDMLDSQEQPSVDLRLKPSADGVPGAPALIEDIPNGAPGARGNLILNRTCPNLGDSVLIEGTLQFERLDDRPDGRVVGRLVNGVLRSAHTGEIVADQIEGTFDYYVEPGPPFQDPPYPEGWRAPGPA